MARHKREAEPLRTIWTIPDELWERFVLPTLRELDPEPKTGRPRIDPRKALDGIIFQMRSGCQWNHLPAEFGDDASVHRTFQRWIKKGVLDRVWGKLIEFCDELEGVHWDWQSADAAMGKARFGGDHVGPNPTDRAKNGTKHSVLVDADGGLLGIAVAGANVHDSQILQDTLAAVVTDFPDTLEHPQHLCLDKGYDNPTGEAAALVYGYVPHIRRIGEEKLDDKKQKKHPARRWVVERTLAWLSKCRAILIRYNKKSCNYLGLIKLASVLLWFRRAWGLQAF